MIPKAAIHPGTAAAAGGGVRSSAPSTFGHEPASAKLPVQKWDQGWLLFVEGQQPTRARRLSVDPW